VFRANRPSPITLLVCAVACASTCVPAARADEIRFKNGDRLTGKITEGSGGKLKITTGVAGDVTVDLKDVETFTTDEPLEIRLDDGRIVRQRVQPSQTPGAVSAGETDVELSRVKSVNAKGPRWTGAIVAGGLLARGNSDTENLNISIEASRRGADDRISANAGYIYSRQADPDTGDKSTTADNWFAAGKYDYFFSEKFYGFGALRVEHDTIADLDLRLTPSLGVGYQWVERPNLNFATEAGLAWVYEEYSEGDSDDHVAARLAYHFDMKFNERVGLVHNVEYLPSLEDLEDFNVNADAGVRASLTKTMFTEFKVEWRFDATPAADADKNDVRYLLGVGWTF
jgi:putative salt-induced outer membrane protein YdiY